MNWTLKLLLTSLLMLGLGGCAVFTETIVVEKPTYIERPLPKLKVYDVNATFKFEGLINEGNYTKVPKQQLKDFINLKQELEKNLKKSNDQTRFYLQMVK